MYSQTTQLREAQDSGRNQPQLVLSQVPGRSEAGESPKQARQSKYIKKKKHCIKAMGRKLRYGESYCVAVKVF